MRRRRLHQPQPSARCPPLLPRVWGTCLCCEFLVPAAGTSLLHFSPTSFSVSCVDGRTVRAIEPSSEHPLCWSWYWLASPSSLPQVNYPSEKAMKGVHCNTKRAVCQESVCTAQDRYTWTHMRYLHRHHRCQQLHIALPNRPRVHGSAVVLAAAKTWVFQALISAGA